MENIIPYWYAKKQLQLNKALYIQNYCSIKDYTISLNGKPIYTDNTNDVKSFFKNGYKHLEINHAKFFKMDNLCKLAFLASEVLLKHADLSSKTKENMAIVLANNSASLDTDRKHQETISSQDNYYPSPAVFVYTLPNIAIGEISIRHQIRGENAFFVSETFNTLLMEQYLQSLMANNKSKHALCGWVNFDNGISDAFMYLVTEEGDYKHSQNTINRLYTKK